MSINTPNGILDITNAIVRVSKMEFQQATGFDTVINNVARNTILLSDTAEYSAATTHHNWALKLPNAWAFSADVYLDSGADGLGDHTFKLNFFNDTNTAITNGYTLGLNGTALTLSYDGTQIDSATLPSTLNTGAWRKLFVLFERDTIAVAVDGEAVYHYVDTSGPRPRVYGDDPGYIVFYHEAGVGAPRKIKNLKFVNGDKWHKDPNSSNIAYIGGSVGIGTGAPTATLEVAGNTKSTNVVATSGVYGEILGSNAISASTGTFSGDLASTSGVYGEILGSNAISASTVSAVTVNSNVVAGNVVTTSNLEVGTANLFVDTTTGNVGVGTNTPIASLDIRGNIYSQDVICQTQHYEYSSTNAVYVTSGTFTLLTCPFTPKYSNSKILIQLSCPVQSSSTYFNIFVDRGSSRITSNPGNYGIISYNSATDLSGHFIHTGTGYDLPATTSTINYNVVAEYGSGSTLVILTQQGKVLVSIHELCQ
jgi:hypothetical protein